MSSSRRAWAMRGLYRRSLSAAADMDAELHGRHHDIDATPSPPHGDGRSDGLVRPGSHCPGGPGSRLDLGPSFPAHVSGRHRGGPAARARGNARRSRSRARDRRARGTGNGTCVHGSRCRESVGTASAAPRGSPRAGRRRRYLVAHPAADLAERAGRLGRGFRRAARRGRRTRRRRSVRAKPREAPRGPPGCQAQRRGGFHRDAHSARPVLRVGQDQDRPPSGAYGSFILGLSGFSESIEPWKEWPGQPRLAIHGTDDPADAGQAVSKGCVRVLNSLLLRRLRDVPMGTPVVIRP